MDDNSLVGHDPHASAQSEVDDNSLSDGDEQNSSLPESVNEYGGRLANDPSRPQGQVHRPLALGSDLQQIVILALPRNMPIVIGLCLLQIGWEGASSREDVGTATRPEYCMTVVQSESIPRCVKESREKLANACASTRRDALQALKGCFFR